MINWKVRIKNKYFWITLIPALFLFIQSFAWCIGFELNLTDLQNHILCIINSMFAMLSLFGIVNDPTTKGFNDGNLAMTYDKPCGGEKENKE